MTTPLKYTVGGALLLAFGLVTWTLFAPMLPSFWTFLEMRPSLGLTLFLVAGPYLLLSAKDLFSSYRFSAYHAGQSAVLVLVGLVGINTAGDLNDGRFAGVIQWLKNALPVVPGNGISYIVWLTGTLSVLGVFLGAVYVLYAIASITFFSRRA
ncbi:hypothetical protein F6X40_11390 [Paraburkholderia sp. UCT31]|uniref:hypothetical protein n=1 Tax=Paraburkholderia sp. UCT31 TaxID=2615209 RepID=UPI001655C681|nr:hypothetical protein [Paraburkholderia sp. UCT31]MBC8737408.1 hypothetical protein [Paraburkholderia sp. UCT31]